MSRLLSWYQSTEEARYLLEGSLVNENVLYAPEEQRSVVINNRGRRMKDKSIKSMFRRLPLSCEMFGELLRGVSGFFVCPEEE